MYARQGSRSEPIFPTRDGLLSQECRLRRRGAGFDRGRERAVRALDAIRPLPRRARTLPSCAARARLLWPPNFRGRQSPVVSNRRMSFIPQLALQSKPASVPADMVNHASAVLGIPLRFWLFGTRSNGDLEEIADLSRDALKTDDTDRATSRSGFFRRPVKTGAFRQAQRRRR